MPEIKTYTREQLIAICEKAIVPHSKWADRDTFTAIKGVGECLVLLRAGCKFEILYEAEANGFCTNDKIIWVTFWVKNFMWFEVSDGDADPEGIPTDSDGSRLVHYLPTEKRLEATKGKDWY
jgi:hypothetical protein